MKSLQFRVVRSCAAALVLLAASTAPFAQSMDDVPVDALLAQAQAAFRQIDARNAASVWDNASPVMRGAVKRDEFVSRVEGDRSDVGAITGRTWQNISRALNTEGNADRIPAGYYININSLAQDGNGKLIRELISFRLDNDRKWRMTGYVAQKVDSK